MIKKLGHKKDKLGPKSPTWSVILYAFKKEFDGTNQFVLSSQFL